MLPSKGFFNTIPCPYYESGYCGRHHCHYKHNKKEKTEINMKAADKEEEKKGLDSGKNVTSLTTMPTPKILVDEKPNVQSENHINEKNKKPESVQEVSKVSPDKSLSLAPLPSSPVPRYKPTPIAELKKRHIPVFNAPSRSASIVERKKIVPEVKKPKTEYVPESVNGVPLPFRYNPTPTATVKSVERPEYSPEVNSDNQSVPHSYIPSKIGEEPSLPAVIYVPEGGSETNVDYVPGSNKNPELPCYVPQSSSSSFLYSLNYGSETFLKDHSFSGSINENHSSNTVNNKSELNDFDNLNFAEINDEINLLQEILEEDGRNESDEESLKNSDSAEKETFQAKTTHNKSDKNKNLNDKETNASNLVKESNNNLHLLNVEIQLKNETNKENTIAMNNICGNFGDNSSVIKNTTVSTKDITTEVDKKHKLNLDKDKSSKNDAKREDKDRSKSGKNRDEKSKKSTKHKHDHESKSHRSSSHSHRSSSKKHSHSNKGSHRDKSSEKFDKCDKSKHKKKSSKKKDFEVKKHHSKKSSSHFKRSKSDLNTNYSHRKSVGRKTSGSSSGDNEFDNGETYSDDGDVEIVQETLPSILITDSESEPEDEPVTNNSPKQEEGIINERKRVAHTPVSSSSISPPKQVRFSRKSSMNPQTDLLNRWQRLRSFSEPDPPTNASAGAAGQTKIRIAHVPNVAKLLNAKKQLLRSGPSTMSLERASTSAGSSSFNGGSDAAHRGNVHLVGNSKNKPIDRPSQSDQVRKPLSNKSRLLLTIRQFGLISLYEESIKIYNSEIAWTKAQNEESEISERTANKKVYQNAVRMAVLKFRKEAAILTGVRKSENSEGSGETSTSIYYPAYTFGLNLYECMAGYILTEDLLISNGYPQKHPTENKCAFIHPSGQRQKSTFKSCDPNVFECINCKTQFRVDKYGISITENDCEYHWGRQYNKKHRSEGWVRVYSCCSNDEQSIPCTSGQFHIRETADENCLRGFVSTRPPPEDMEDKDCGIYALDCEMCYTTIGLELTRVTVVDVTLKTVYDTLVLPKNRILDYCTRFSGITEDKMKNCTTQLKEVQNHLLEMFNSKTILIGHSLENDLKMLKIIHNTVVDTSVVFPHRLGPPKKNSLQKLAYEKLKKNIQNNDAGHDSTEDAVTALELMLKLIKDECRRHRPRKIINCDS